MRMLDPVYFSTVMGINYPLCQSFLLSKGVRDYPEDYRIIASNGREPTELVVQNRGLRGLQDSKYYLLMKVGRMWYRHPTGTEECLWEV